jgi:general stress protein YciG
MTTANRAVRDFLAEIGRKGGQAKVAKGFSNLSEREKSAIGKKAAAARWGTKKKKLSR